MNKISPNLEVDLIYSPIINFAMQQNHVPVIRKLTVKEILKNQISLPKGDLIREAAKLFGFARTGAQVELAMKKGIEKAYFKQIVQVKNERIIVR